MKTSIDWMQGYDLLPRNSRVLCALSGGRDSVYLLYRLMEWAKERNLTVLAAHYNHHLRGEESDRDEQFVRSLCEALQIPLYVGGGQVADYAKEHGLGVEEAARALRYTFLEDTRKECAADVIATAHHADDLAETMLLQLARGAGSKGLSGIPPRRGVIVRPILTVEREEIDDYLERKGISYVEDSTNALDNGNRNLLRHHVMPILKQVNPSFVAHAVQSAMLLREDDAYIQKQADAFLCNYSPADGLDAKALAKLDFPVASRVIRSLWGSGLQYNHVRQVLDLCDETGVAYAHVPNAVIRVDGGRLWTDEVIEIPQVLVMDGECGEGEYGSYRIQWKTQVFDNEIHNSFNTFCLKYENIKGVVRVTSRESGDSVQFAGTAYRKKLKKLFSEQKFTQPQRVTIPVLRDDEGIVAVYGFGIAQRCVPEVGDKIMYVQCDK